jgi:hypothetical protein
VKSATISSSQLLNNRARLEGGGLWANQSGAGESLIRIEDSLVKLNKVTESSGFGGGLWIDLHGVEFLPSLSRLEIAGTTLIDNEATEAGGGAYIEGKLPSEVSIVNSSVIDNTAGAQSVPGAGKGGGLYIGHEPFLAAGILDVSIEQTTISGNEAFDEGGGLWLGINNPATMTGGDLNAALEFVTIHNNFAPDGGGLYSHDDARVSATLKHTIVSGNEEVRDSGLWDNVAGTIEIASSYNLFGTSPATLPATNNILNNNAPGLRPLADNGGPRLPNGDPMLTHQPLHTSPAVDAGDPLVAFDPDEFDQRGPSFFRVYDQPNNSGGPVDIGAIELGAARVLDLIISESNFNLPQHEFSFSEGTFQGQPMTGSGNQLRTVPVGGADQVEIRFSEEMPTIGTGAIDVNSLSLIGLTTGSTLTPSGFAYDDETFTATWTFSAPLPADMWVISIPDAIIDMSGNQLDGEWTNPFSINTLSTAGVSVFPSGNGVAGGDFNFVMTILPGDHDRDNDVDGMGFLEWQQMIGGPDQKFQDADFNGDGWTDGDDLAIHNANFGIQLLNQVFADFDGDSDVDGFDLDIWKAHKDTAGGHEDGDANCDGFIDWSDKAIWQWQEGLEINWVL